MVKHSFYTLIKENKKIQAKLVNGYSDGTFYYYKKDDVTWHAIHPLIGLSIATGSQRKYAQENAHSVYVQENLKKLYDNKAYYQSLGTEFDKHVNILKEKNNTKREF